MVDVGGKEISAREAVASGLVRMSAETRALVLERVLPKGDVLPPVLTPAPPFRLTGQVAWPLGSETLEQLGDPGRGALGAVSLDRAVVHLGADLVGDRGGNHLRRRLIEVHPAPGPVAQKCTPGTNS